MTDRLNDQVAVVTGGGRGVGRGVALLLAAEGATVVVNDVGCEIDGTGSSRGPADKVVEEIKQRGGEAVANYDDVALVEGGENLIKTTLDTYGRLDALVNSVAVRKDRVIHQMTPEDFDQVVRSSVKGTFVPTRFAAVHFRQQRSGRIVNMTSDAGLGSAGCSNYAAASEAIIGLTRTVARDLGRYGVTCNAISPTVQTRVFPGTVRETRSDGSTGPSLELGEWGGPGYPDDPENVAPLAVLLCTDALPAVNGNVFGVRRGSIFLYSNPSIQRSLHKWGVFTLDELDEQVPKGLTEVRPPG